VPDRRRHRGPHPDDARLFAAAAWPALREATADLGWLLGRGYALDAALKLVGDHRQLHRRQRMAVARCAAGPASAAVRRRGRGPVQGEDIVVDGFNVLVSVEAALSGGVLLRGADGLLRDLASVHGTYRAVDETAYAMDHLAAALTGAGRVEWVLDRPVSNSGRVAALARARGWDARLEDAADRALARAAAAGARIATADGPLLDRCPSSVDLVGAVVAGLPDAWIVDLAP
jgi:hypothetical protein